MKKTISVVVLMTFISVILLGCQSEDNTTPKQQTEESDIPNTQQQSDDNDKIILEGEISNIILKNLHDSNKIIFDKANDIEIIKNIIVSAKKEPGIVDMDSPEYRLVVAFTDGNESAFYLWIGEKGMKSTLMQTEDSHTIYTVSEDMTDQLIDLIEK